MITYHSKSQYILLNNKLEQRGKKVFYWEE